MEVDPYGKSPVAQQGWECPKCGAVMAPFYPTCFNCNGKRDSKVELKSGGDSD